MALNSIMHIEVDGPMATACRRWNTYSGIGTQY
jgi:hypothetical protein